ncbi:hypothetical protein H311_03014, partial [Anncaliia algerae PRA109]
MFFANYTSVFFYFSLLLLCFMLF